MVILTFFALVAAVAISAFRFFALPSFSLPGWTKPSPSAAAAAISAALLALESLPVADCLSEFEVTTNSLTKASLSQYASLVAGLVNGLKVNSSGSSAVLSVGTKTPA